MRPRMLLACRGTAFALASGLLLACRQQAIPERRGDLSMKGGSPTIRKEFHTERDDPATSNDESNDKPRGHFGTLTLQVTSLSSGNSYPLDADLDGSSLRRLYFPKGGWIDFPDCELDTDLSGSCTDEQGRDWDIEGPALGSSIYDDTGQEEEEEEEEDEEEDEEGVDEGRDDEEQPSA